MAREQVHHLGVKSASPTQPWQDGPQLSYSLPPHERPRPRPTQLSLSRTPELPQLCERTLAIFKKQTTNQRLDPKAWKLLRGRHGWAAVWGTGCLGSEIPPPLRPLEHHPQGWKQELTVCGSLINVSGATLPSREFGQIPGRGGSLFPRGKSPSLCVAPPWAAVCKWTALLLLLTFGYRNNDRDNVSNNGSVY